MASSDPKHPVSTIGPAPSLADALRRFRAAQALASESPPDPLVKGSPTVVEVTAALEKRALGKARKSMQRASGAGLEFAAFAAVGWTKYRRHGGKRSLGQFLAALR
ncbi:MAG TPA: hypothetical protein VMU99_09580 [Acidimicrobiales bacterium]|nr:hypothetical protein [Acidimicrobiales bacterium]